jgi:hypothetical protein
MKEVGKATIVSGCPRSGTSLMMLCMSMAVGEEKIIGVKFPQKRHLIGTATVSGIGYTWAKGNDWP